MANITRFDPFSLVTIPGEVKKEAKADAEYADGVLTLTLSTKARASARKLAVS